MKRHEGCSISGSASDFEIPLLSSFFYLFGEAEAWFTPHLLDLSRSLGNGDPSRRHSQVGSLAGAAHLSNDNAGVLR